MRIVEACSSVTLAGYIHLLIAVIVCGERCWATYVVVQGARIKSVMCHVS